MRWIGKKYMWILAPYFRFSCGLSELEVFSPSTKKEEITILDHARPCNNTSCVSLPKNWPLAKTALAKPVLRHTHAKKRKSQWLLFSSTREAIHTYKTQCKRWRYITNWASSDVCAKTPKPSQQSCVDNTSTQHIHAHKLPHTLSFLHSLMLNPLGKDTRDGKRHRCYTHTCS